MKWALPALGHVWRDAMVGVVVTGLIGAANFVLTPFYARLLGPAAWGLVALCVLFQSLVLIVNFGLTETQPRDVARVADDAAQRRALLGLHLRTYLLLGAIVGALGVWSVPWLLGSFVDEGALRATASLDLALRAAVLTGVVQLCNGVWIAHWTGLQRQGYAAWRTAGFFVLRHVGMFAAAAVWGWSVLAWALTGLCAVCVEWGCNARAVYGQESGLGWQSAGWGRALGKLWGHRALALTVLLGALVGQMDRLMLAAWLTPEQFGVYVMVLMLGLAMLQFQYPVMGALYPAVARDSAMRLLPRNLALMGFLNVLPIAVLAWFGREIVTLYLHTVQDAAHVVALFKLLLGFVLLHGLYQVFAQYLMAFGAVRWLLSCHVWSLLSVVGIMHTWGGELGMVSGGLSWLTVSIVQLLHGVIWLVWVRCRAGL